MKKSPYGRNKRKLYEDKDRQREVPLKGSKLDPEEYRSDFWRDYGRLIHAPSFRRLQGKLQLLPASDDDFFRNRLTHSLEVAQIAKSIGHRLNSREAFLADRGLIDLDMLAFAGLGHDLGHPPFGHAGEEILDDLMDDYGGFEGNAQTLRILARVEEKAKITTDGPGQMPIGDLRRGLNLTFRSLASILKYDSQVPVRRADRANPKKISKGYYGCDAELAKRIKEAVAPGFKGKFKTIECSVMDVADDIAYSTYDMEDCFRRCGQRDSQISSFVIQSLSLEGGKHGSWRYLR